MKTSILVPVDSSLENFSNFIEELKHIDDFSNFNIIFRYNPDIPPELTKYLHSDPFFLHENVILKRNVICFPITKNINLLINDCVGSHAILLRSDTKFYSDSFVKLVECHLQNPNAGIVSPLTNGWNCGTLNISPNIFSYGLREEIFLQDRSLSFKVPYITGPCFFINNKLLLEQDYFSEWYNDIQEAEIEFSLKASRLGWDNIISISSLVINYNLIKPDAESDNINYLDTNFSFSRNSNEFNKNSKFRLFSLCILTSLFLKQDLRSVLYVCHAPIFSKTAGGTERHVKELIETNKSSLVCFFLSPASSNTYIFGGTFKDLFFESSLSEAELVSLLQVIVNSVDNIHIHHIMNLPFRMIETLMQSESKKLFSIHDYYLACPTINMLKSDTGKFCKAESDVAVCEKCINRTIHRGTSLASYRVSSNKMLENIDELYFPSMNVKKYFSKVLKFKDTSYIRPHNLDHLFECQLSKTYHPKRNRIIILGAIGKHKGVQFVEEVYDELINKNFELEVWGEIDSKRLKNKIKIRNYYDPKQLKSLFEIFQPEFVLMPSEAAETYGYTFFESLLMSNAIPIVGPFGNPADICRENKVGLILEAHTLEALEELILNADRKLIIEKIEAFRNLLINSSEITYNYTSKNKLLRPLVLGSETPKQQLQFKVMAKMIILKNYQHYILAIRAFQLFKKLTRLFTKLRLNQIISIK